MFLVQETCKFVLLKEPIYHCCKTGKLAPFLGSVVSLNRSRLIKSRLLVTFKCLYNAASLSCFTFCFSRKADVAPFFVEPGIVSDVSSNLLVFGIL